MWLSFLTNLYALIFKHWILNFTTHTASFSGKVNSYKIPRPVNCGVFLFQASLPTGRGGWFRSIIRIISEETELNSGRDSKNFSGVEIFFLRILSLMIVNRLIFREVAEVSKEKLPNSIFKWRSFKLMGNEDLILLKFTDFINYIFTQGLTHPSRAYGDHKLQLCTIIYDYKFLIFFMHC